MSYYKTGLVSKNIDPIHHSKQRSEFHLDPNLMYVSNMRLLNLGVVLKSGVVVAVYNLLGGAVSVIKNIYLYDGRQVLDQITNHAEWMSFVHYNQSNSQAIELTRNLHRNFMGFVYNRIAGITIGDDAPIIPVFPRISTIDLASPVFVRNDEDLTAQAFLNLAEVFPLLAKMTTIDTAMFPNFRVVIEYNTEVSIAAVGMTDPKINSFTQPLLVVDEITNKMAVDNIRQQFKGVVWNAIEVESVLLPAVTLAAELAKPTQTRSFKLSGHTNKTIGRVVVQKSSTDYAKSLSYLYKSLGSEAMIGEVWQVAINNQNLFPNSGVTSSNEKLSILTQTWGVCNSIPCSTGGYLINNNYVDSMFVLPDQITGHTDYFGFNVKGPVKSFSITYTREIKVDQDAFYNSALTLNIFAEVQKVIVPNKGGGYTVSYL